MKERRKMAAKKKVHPVVITKVPPDTCSANKFAADPGDDVVFAFDIKDKVSKVQITFPAGDSPFTGSVELNKNMTIRADAPAKSYEYKITWINDVGSEERGGGSGKVPHG